MNKPWKLILLLTGIFIAGGVSGAFLTFRFGRNWIAQQVEPEQRTTIHLKKLSERLKLSTEQVEQLKPVIRRNMDELAKMRGEHMASSRTVFERMDREISALLTSEQRAKFEEYNREVRERIRKAMQNKQPERREGRPAGDRPPGPPPEGAPREPAK